MNDQDKIEFIHAVFPQISEGGQDYLRGVAETLKLIQAPAVSSFFAIDERKTLFQKTITEGGKVTAPGSIDQRQNHRED